jgi:hypothetical protein
MDSQTRYAVWQKRYGALSRIESIHVRRDGVLVAVGRSGNHYPLSEDDSELATIQRRLILGKEYELASYKPRPAPARGKGYSVLQ